MPFGITNQFFDNYDKQEQNLLEDLVIESIEISGINCYYIARNFNNFNKIYGSDDQSSYTNTWLIALYLKNVLGFAGDREFMSKFAGLEIRDQLVFSIPRRTFEMKIAADPNFPPLPNNMPGPANRPREGDLIWFPFNKKVFIIRYVNLTDMFWQLGKLYTWEVTCELFEYSGEIFNTGIADIDRIQTVGDLNIFSYLVTDTDGTTPLLTEDNDYWTVDSYDTKFPIQDNIVIKQEANNYINWDDLNTDPFAQSNNVMGPSV